MPLLIPLILKNIAQLSPAHAAILKDKGCCFGLTATWMQACWGNKEKKFCTRLKKWLGRDLKTNPLTLNGKKYYSFKEIKEDFEYLKIKDTLSRREAKLVKTVLETLAFLDALVLYNDPGKASLKKFSTQNLEKAYYYVKPLLLENTNISCIYNHTWILSKKKDLFIDFLKTLEEILPNPEIATLELSSGIHTIGLKIINGEWKIFNSNTITEKSLYEDFSPKAIIDAFNFLSPNADIATFKMAVYLSPLAINPNQIDTVKQLLESSIAHTASRDEVFNNFNEINHDGTNTTLLWLAAEDNDLELVKMLYEKGASIHRTGGIDLTQPIHLAAENGNIDLAKFLLEHNVKLTAATSNNSLPIHRAAFLSHSKEMVKFILENSPEIDIDIKNNQGNTPLILAAKSGDLDVVQYLTEKGASIELNENNSPQPLHAAASAGSTELVTFLLNNGANIDKKNNLENTALHEAILHGHLDVVKLLLDKGASLNSGNKGSTPLQMAADKSHKEIMQLLLERGVDISAQNTAQNSTLHVAAKHDVSEIIQLLLRNGTPLDQTNADGDTPLHIAAKKGSLQTTQILAQQGADLNILNNEGLSPLLLAASKGKNKIVDLLAEYTDIIDEAKILALAKDKNSSGRMSKILLHAFKHNNILSTMAVLRLFLIHLEKTDWTVQGKPYQKEPDVISVIKKTIRTALENAKHTSDPEKIYQDALNASIANLQSSTNKRNPLEQDTYAYKNLLKLLSPYQTSFEPRQIANNSKKRKHQ